MATPNNQSTGWVGWVYFAGILMIVRAFFEALMGVVSLTKEDFFVVTSNQLTVFNFTAWGWVHLAVAVVLLTAGFSVLSGHLYGRVVGVVVTAMAMLANLAFLSAYPVWAIAALVIDGFVLYALVVHGAEAKN